MWRGESERRAKQEPTKGPETWPQPGQCPGLRSTRPPHAGLVVARRARRRVPGVTEGSTAHGRQFSARARSAPPPGSWRLRAKREEGMHRSAVRTSCLAGVAGKAWHPGGRSAGGTHTSVAAAQACPTDKRAHPGRERRWRGGRHGASVLDARLLEPRLQGGNVLHACKRRGGEGCQADKSAAWNQTACFSDAHPLSTTPGGQCPPHLRNERHRTGVEGM